MLFNDRRRKKERAANANERYAVHNIAGQDINPYVSRKEKYAQAAKAVNANPTLKNVRPYPGLPGKK